MTPDEQPSAKEFGVLIGRVDAIGEQIAEMRRTNTAEHAAVIAKLDGLRDGLDDKASKTWVREIDKRTDKLESIRDEGSGAAKLIRVTQGALVAGVAILAFVVGKGGVG